MFVRFHRPFVAAGVDRQVLSRHHRHNHLRSALLLGGIVGWMALVGWLVAGDVGILWAAGGTAVLMLAQPVRSTTLLRALYGAVPLGPSQAPDLFAATAELARRAELPRVPQILYIPRPEMIALSTGWGSDSAVALSDGMLRRMGARELVAVLAHEISHLRAGDLRLLRLAEAAGRLTRALAFAGLLLTAFYLPGMTDGGDEVPWLAILAVVVAPLVADLLTLTLSRTREFEADSGAAELTGDPGALISALMRLDTVQGDGWERLRRQSAPAWLRLIRTHPTTAERVARLAELAPPRPRPWLVLPDILLPSDVAGTPVVRRWWR